MSYVIGIDPGMSGAIAVYSHSGLVDVVDIPVEKYIKNKKKATRINRELLLQNFISREYLKYPMTAFLELVSAAPTQGRKQGSTSMFQFGRGYGHVEMALTAAKIKIQYVVPTVWKRHFNLLKTEKDAARLFARDRYSYHLDNFFERKKDSGRADAALMAEYGHESIYGKI